MKVLDFLRNSGFNEDDIEQIKITADVSVATLVYSLERFCELLEIAKIPKELKSELILALIKKEK